MATTTKATKTTTATTARMGRPPVFTGLTLKNIVKVIKMHFKKDRPKMLAVFVTGYVGTAKNPAPTPDIFKRLLAGEIEWREEDGTVIFTA